ncbi:MAG: MOSC N-terminal beta barrel domain-containing protein [Pseudomonadota bacterium]
MKTQLAHILRHPIKGHGREALDQVTLSQGATMPWDRAWAIAHEAAKADGTAWASCANFSRVAKAPLLAAISAQLDEASEQLTLTHPDRPPITLHPEKDADALMDWVRPLMPEDRAQSARVLRVPGRGMTDAPFASLSLSNLASNTALSGMIGADLSLHRWRSNLWVDGMAPWAEFDLVGKTLQLGEAQFKILEPIERCLATTANPDTGARDADTLGALRQLGHQNFGVHAEVVRGGQIKLGDTLEVL